MTRTGFLAYAAAAMMLAASSAAARDGGFDRSSYDQDLQQVVRGKRTGAPIAGAAIAVMVGNRLIYSGAAGCAEFEPSGPNCARALLPTSKMRVASISKLAVALGIKRLVDEGRLDLDDDASEHLGWTLRNPAFPEAPISVRSLLSHTSSVVDPEEYWVAAPGDLRTSLFADAPPFDAEHAPGAWFRYANLNYGILAGVIEGASGQRFDLFMRQALFAPAGLDIGFNWSGVTSEARKNGAILYRRADKKWEAVADSEKILSDASPFFLAEEGLDRAAYLANYHPGENPTLFSPQGGLRASVMDLVALLRLLQEQPELTQEQWRYDAISKNGDTEEGYFSAFGLGAQILDRDGKLLKTSNFVGHPGEAYGLYGGAWFESLATDDLGREPIRFAFVATGVNSETAKGVHPTINKIEERLVRLALEVARKGAEPHPFDESADAMSDVDAALARSIKSGRRPLLILGGNWCHDSRGLAKKFQTEPLKSVIDQGFDPVWVDVGRRDRNLDVARRFGIEALIGTPTILVLSSDGALLNRDSVHDWRTADSRSLEEAIAYFKSFAPSP